MLEDMEEEESSSILSIGRDTQQPMIYGWTITTLMLQNFLKAQRSLHVPKSSRIAVLDQDMKIEA